MATATRKYIVSQFYHTQEETQTTVDSADEARRLIDDGNRTAAKGWRWGLSPINFIGDDGVDLTIAEANAIRRECGQNEW